MKVFITGGTGFVGSAIVQNLSESDHQVTVLTRSGGGHQNDNTVFIQGDPTITGSWQETASEADLVINLAGASIFGKWTDDYKQKIEDSRIQTTGHLVEAMNRADGPPKTLLSASAIGYYGFHGDEELDEKDQQGMDFLADLSGKWECQAWKAAEKGHRIVPMRFGVVLDKSGGALARMLPLFRKGLGGRLGKGHQWFSWIHRRDLVRAIDFLINHPHLTGPFNFTAPTPVTNAQLTQTLSRILHRPAILPAPAAIIKMAMGEMATMLLEGQRVLPRQLLEHEFTFQFPTLEEALTDILGG